MQETLRPLVAGFVIVVFILFMLITSATDQLTGIFDRKPDFPDFSYYKSHRTLSAEKFPIQTKHDRIIAVGDIHGMNSSLSALLTKLSYDPQFDTLIHLGDIVTKGGVKGSLDVLSFMDSNDIMGVRGNNDQAVIEWRAWRDWIQSLPGGRKWLDTIDSEHTPKDDEDDDREEFHLGPDFWIQDTNKDWEEKIPQGWKLFGRHYKVARAMSQEHYNYLRSLPVVIHAVSGHTFFVHAGMLAADPNCRLEHPSQPLSHWPAMRTSNPNMLRSLQEAALLKDIPQNKDPWVLLNMRSVHEDGSISRKKKGTPWPELWNNIMNMCSGVDSDLSDSFSEGQHPLSGTAKEEDMRASQLPCFPSMIVYGHIAARGLDVKRWSVGLDTGCVNKGRLSALILDKGSFLTWEDEEFEQSAYRLDDISEHSPSLQYGDSGQARIVSVEC
ncbi:Metallo-dependent phosphatase-like protein [Scleroderma yunnanense]